MRFIRRVTFSESISTPFSVVVDEAGGLDTVTASSDSSNTAKAESRFRSSHEPFSHAGSRPECKGMQDDEGVAFSCQSTACVASY